MASGEGGALRALRALLETRVRATPSWDADAVVATLEDLTARDYVDRDALDLDPLST